MSQLLIASVEESYRRAKPLEFEIGDTVTVHVRIREGEKERVQPYNGVAIARRGTGVRETFMVRHIDTNGQGVVRIFPVHSPNVAKVEVIRSGKVRRAKLYFLRDRIGKARRLRERRSAASKRAAAAKKAAAAAKRPVAAASKKPVAAAASASAESD